MNRDVTWNVFSRHLVRLKLAPLPSIQPTFQTVSIQDRLVSLGVDEGQIRIGPPGSRPYATFPMRKSHKRMDYTLGQVLRHVQQVGTENVELIKKREDAQAASRAANAKDARQKVAQKQYQERLARIVVPPGAAHSRRLIDTDEVPDGFMPVRLTFEGNLTSDQIRALYRAWQEVLTKPGRGAKKAVTAYDHLGDD